MTTQKDEEVLLDISPMRLGDLDELMVIELDSFTAPWSKKSYEEVLALDTVSGFVARAGGEMVGYMLTQSIVGEMELHTFAVKSSWRRRGIGKRLIEYMIEDARKRGIKDIFLLVRVSNLAARTLYEKMDFHSVGIRRSYYHDNLEDAAIMVYTTRGRR
jgi:ribosomal-protein-alanine N-acetyltransferase